MAELRRKPGAISKGMKCTAIIEDAINDVLVVSLNIVGRKFHGILFDSTKRNFPPGFCMPATDKDPDSKDPQNSESGFEQSATILRHTYNQSSENSNNSNQNQAPIYSRPPKDRPSRNIRLRPRSTLCSKCKAVCQETDKGIIPVGQVVKQEKPTEKPISQPATQSQNLPHSKSPLREGLRKRQLVQKDSGSCSSSTSSGAKISTEKSQSAITRSSPFIKINIGEGTVLKIPPRYHDEVDGESNNSQVEDNVDSASNSQDSDSDRKARKTLRKVRDRSSQFTPNSYSELEPLVERESDDVELASHHKKHKRKHKHRKESVENDEKAVVLPTVDENGESVDEHSTIMQRPRLLYTWRQNKGLSPRRENMDSNIDSNQNVSPKQTFDTGFDQNSSVGPKVLVRHKSVDLGPKKEYKLRSREKRLSTESSESVIIEANSGSEFDKYSMISSATEDESEGGKSLDDLDQSSEEDRDDSQKPPSVETTPNVDVFRSLMMKIHTHDVTKCIATDGRTIHVGDIVWGKIKGFPWWPGRVLSISVSERESGLVIRKLAHVSWFGSSTMSHIQCSDLYPFLEDFKLRYNRKKRGPYKVAIKQATIAAQSVTNTHHIDFTEYDL